MDARIIAFAAGLGGFLPVAVTVAFRPWRDDGLAYLRGAIAVAHGEPLYTHETAFANTPLFARLLLPFGWVPESQGAYVWWAGLAAASVLALALGALSRMPATFLVILGVTLGFGFYLGQITPWLALIFMVPPSHRAYPWLFFVLLLVKPTWAVVHWGSLLARNDRTLFGPLWWSPPVVLTGGLAAVVVAGGFSEIPSWIQILADLKQNHQEVGILNLANWIPRPTQAMAAALGVLGPSLAPRAWRPYWLPLLVVAGGWYLYYDLALLACVAAYWSLRDQRDPGGEG